VGRRNILKPEELGSGSKARVLTRGSCVRENIIGRAEGAATLYVPEGPGGLAQDWIAAKRRRGRFSSLGNSREGGSKNLEKRTGWYSVNIVLG